MKLLQFVKLFTNGREAQAVFRFRVSGSGFQALGVEKGQEYGLRPGERNAVLQ
jgi:hypothetical protein